MQGANRSIAGTAQDEESLHPIQVFSDYLTSCSVTEATPELPAGRQLAHNIYMKPPRPVDQITSWLTIYMCSSRRPLPNSVHTNAVASNGQEAVAEKKAGPFSAKAGPCGCNVYSRDQAPAEVLLR